MYILNYRLQSHSLLAHEFILICNHDSLLSKHIIGHKKPTIKLLQRIVIPRISAKWHELGIELYKDSDVSLLDTFKRESSKDYTEGCSKMFNYWLGKYEDATWEKLIKALRAPGINLNSVALDIMKEVVKG